MFLQRAVAPKAFVFLIVLLTSILCFPPDKSNAELVTFEFTAQITQLWAAPPPPGDILQGLVDQSSSVTGYFSYDLDATDLINGPHFGSYTVYAPSFIDLYIGGFHCTYNSGIDYGVVYNNYIPFFNTYLSAFSFDLILEPISNFDTNINVNNAYVTLGFSLTHWSGNASQSPLTSDDLPADLFLNEWIISTFGFAITSDTCPYILGINTDITSLSRISEPVPEPGTMALVFSGLLAFCGLRQYRKKQSIATGKAAKQSDVVRES